MKVFSANPLVRIVCVVLLSSLVPLTHAQTDDDAAWKNPEDPWEGFNRKIFFFNDGVDRYILLPVASAYRFIMPQPLDQGVTNFFGNLLMPISFVNSIFQLKFTSAGVNLGRFRAQFYGGRAGLYRYRHAGRS